MEERDKVITISMHDRATNVLTTMEFIIPGKDLVTKSERELREFFAAEAKIAFDKMLKSTKINQFLDFKRHD